MAVAISASHFARFLPHRALFPSSSRKIPPAIARRMASEKSINAALSAPPPPSSSSLMIFDSHLHVWASPQEASEKYPYHPGKEPTIPGDAAFLLECMAEAGVDGALVVQPINHMFDHSYVTTVLKMYPSKFIGCCLANPAEDGSGIAHLEQLILKDGYRAIRFNPYIWPSGQKMTNDIGKVLFSKAGELGAPVGILCMKFAVCCLNIYENCTCVKWMPPSRLIHEAIISCSAWYHGGLSLHVSEIEELCSMFPSTTVLLDHLGFSKPDENGEENKNFSELLKLSRFPQIYVKFSALFRLSKKPFPYEDLSTLLSQVISSYGASRVMWGSDFPYVVPECGYKGAKEAISLIASHIPLSSSDLEWMMGRTAMQLFHEWKAF
uniref:Uncharacterized protein y4mH n=1 Tax=Anthurium amnicola TaxID=1678845 RepID=A0A1D1XMR8_9ARAE